MTSPPKKDCRNCNRRRIRCDRALPTCAKCKAKGLDCSGYGLSLRWKAPASKFRQHSIESATAEPQIIGIDSATCLQDVDPSLVAHAGLNEFNSAILPATVSQRLLDHYVTSVAPLMVWLDSDRNEYKRLVVPLAETHNSLRLAIVAIAAAHAPTELEMDVNFSQRAYEVTLLLITDGVRRMAGHEAELESPYLGDELEAVLAAALILSNYSLLGSELSLAQVHRQAVRVLIKSTTHAGSSKKELLLFLKNQAAIYDVLVCTANFDAEHIEHAILPDDDPFAPILRLIHEITMSSITGYLSRSRLDYSTIRDLQDRFELAQSFTVLAAAPTLRDCDEHKKEDFMRIVQSFHHAGILYAYKRLEIKGDPMEEYHTVRLFRTFEQFRNLQNSLHNLAWPIFMAGIGSWPNIERMLTVAKLSKLVIKNTRFGHYGNTKGRATGWGRVRREILRMHSAGRGFRRRGIERSQLYSSAMDN